LLQLPVADAEVLRGGGPGVNTWSRGIRGGAPGMNT